MDEGRTGAVEDKIHSPGVPDSKMGLVKERTDPVFETDVMSKKGYLSRHVKVMGHFIPRCAVTAVTHVRNYS